MKLPRKMTVALLAGVSIAGIAGASAASLGNVSASKLGSGSNVVASCDTDGVAVSYTTAFSGGIYVVTDATVSNVNTQCAGQTGSVTLADASNNDLGHASVGVTNSGSFTVHFASAIDASKVENAAILIAG